MKKWLVILISILLIIISTLLYSRYISTSGLVTHEIKITVKNLENSYNGLKIIHFSDIHYGRTIKEDKLNKIVNEINNNKPDIVVFTGDLFDKDKTLSFDEKEELANILKNINTTLGKYIIKGDNDIDNDWENIIEKAGFTNLNDTYNLIYSKNNNPLIISGISSNLNEEQIYNKLTSFNEYMDNTIKKPLYSILLIHEPDYLDKIKLDNYNLILAGHSLGGQIRLPFIGPVIHYEGALKYYNSYYNLNGIDLYVSNGLGTVNHNFRFNNKPSINFYRIVNE